MRRQFMLGAAMAVVLLVVSPGVSPAGDRMNSVASPDFGTWEYWMAEETGNLPVLKSSTHPGKESMGTASPGFGTWEYWEAEETGNLHGSEPSSYSPLTDVPREKKAPISGHESWEYQIGG